MNNLLTDKYNIKNKRQIFGIRSVFIYINLFVIILFILSSDLTSGEKEFLDSDTKKHHHLPDGSFHNRHTSAINKSFIGLIKWRWERTQPEPLNFKLYKNGPKFLKGNRDIPTLTWIGHSTLLIQYKGVNILTDPHLTQRTSPISFAGPKRYTSPGLSLDDLPIINLILISHNYYNHLD